LERGHRFLEIGTGSGYGAAVAREVVGDTGQVTSIEIDSLTHAFAKQNLERAGYADVVVVHGDGGLGYGPRAPYDRIAMTAACTEIPSPLLAQLTVGGRLIAPLVDDSAQRLTVITKHADGTTREVLCDVLYVRLQGQYANGRTPEPVRPRANERRHA
jgi:protein-L-isoaspartate(D-aspartate) O-methyltransferase